MPAKSELLIRPGRSTGETLVTPKAENAVGLAESIDDGEEELPVNEPGAEGKDDRRGKSELASS
jgi:hypothetical protein